MQKYIEAISNLESSKQYSKLGHDKLMAGNYHEALKSYQHALSYQNEQDVNYYHTSLNISVAYLALGQYQRAIHYCDIVIEGSRLYLGIQQNVSNRADYEINLKKAYFLKGQLLYFLGEYDISIAHYEVVLEHDPEYYDVLPYKAAMHFMLRQFNEVDKIIKNIDNLNSRSVIGNDRIAKFLITHLVRAVTYIKQGEDDKYDELITSFEVSNRFDNAHERLCAVEDFCIFGDMLAKLSLLNEAKRLFEHIHNEYPNFIYAKRRKKQLRKQISFQSKKSWQFSKSFKSLVKPLIKEKGYAVLPANMEEIGEVIKLYRRKPVNDYEVRNIYRIYSPTRSKIFHYNLRSLKYRIKNDEFLRTWENLPHSREREAIYSRARTLEANFHDQEYGSARLLPVWHGFLDAKSINGICRDGLANLAHTDAGFFGKGLYFTDHPDYAYKIYSKRGQQESGFLLLNWISFFSAYPLISIDYSNGDNITSRVKNSGFYGSPNYKNYDMHFAVVDPNDGYLPSNDNSDDKHAEFVVFESAQCLTSYLIKLAPKAGNIFYKVNNPYTLFNHQPIANINLLAAAKYVYTNFLSKPYNNPGRWLDHQYPLIARPGEPVIYRPNHGLAFTLRTAFYVPLVVEYYIEFNRGALTDQQIELLRAKINEMQLDLLFHVIGRENEKLLDEIEDKELLKRIEDFQREAKESYIRANSIELIKCVDPDLPDHINKITKICHNIDLMRCIEKPAVAYHERFIPMINDIGKFNFHRLQKFALYCLNETGNRIFGYEVKKASSKNISQEYRNAIKEGRLILLIQEGQNFSIAYRNINGICSTHDIKLKKYINFIAKLSDFSHTKDEIHQYITAMLKKTHDADRDVYYAHIQDYRRDLFVPVSQDVELCFAHLKVAKEKFTNLMEAETLTLPRIPNKKTSINIKFPKTKINQRYMKLPIVKGTDTHWYTGDEIDKLFKSYLSGHSKIVYLDTMLATNYVSQENVLRDNLVQFDQRRMNDIRQGLEVSDRVLVPINLRNNHWALLYIIYSTDAATLPDIYYFDPLGGEAPDEVKRALQGGFSLRRLSDVTIIKLNRRVQHDSYNCGPWIVEAARAIARNGEVPEASLDINQARIEHRQIISPDDEPLESSQNHHKLC